MWVLTGLFLFVFEVVEGENAKYLWENGEIVVREFVYFVIC